MSVIYFIFIVISIALLVLVLIQKSESGALGSGSQSGYINPRERETSVGKITLLFGILFFVCSLFLSIFSSSKTDSVLNKIEGTVIDVPQGEQQKTIETPDSKVSVPTE